MAGIDRVTGPVAVGLAVVGVAVADGDGGAVVAGLGGPELDGPELDGPELDGAELDGRGELPDGAVSLHPASAVTTTRAPTSLTPRR